MEKRDLELFKTGFEDLLLIQGEKGMLKEFAVQYQALSRVTKAWRATATSKMEIKAVRLARAAIYLILRKQEVFLEGLDIGRVKDRDSITG